MNPFTPTHSRRGFGRLLVVGAATLTLTLAPPAATLAGPSSAGGTDRTVLHQDGGDSPKIVPTGQGQDDSSDGAEDADVATDDAEVPADRDTDVPAAGRTEVLKTPGIISPEVDLQPSQWTGALDGRLVEPFAVPARPVRISSDAIGLDAEVTPREIVGGEMQTPKDEFEVSWYKETAAPGERGNAVFAGHLNWYGVPQAVFYGIDQLQKGDRITVTDDEGNAFVYVVKWVKLVDVAGADVDGVVGATERPSLTLITCGGDWNPAASEYDQRTVVRAVLTNDR